MDFLQSVARYQMESRDLKDWSRTTFVFPNHRSSVFFADAVSAELAERERRGEPHIIFGLSLTTIGDLMAKGSGLRVADQVTLRCELYRAYRATLGADEEPMTFESFYTWGNAIVRDFDDIDKALAKAHLIYSNVEEWHRAGDDLTDISPEQRAAIEQFWGVEFQKSTDIMGTPTERLPSFNFVESYGRMAALYTTFREQLRSKGLAYPGMLYRDSAERLSEGDTPCSWDEDGRLYVFIGFSHLSKAEERIMRKLYNRDRAQFFWDYSPAMLTDDEANDMRGSGYAVAQWAISLPAPKGFAPPEGVPPCEQSCREVTTTYSQTQTAVLANELFGSDGTTLPDGEDMKRSVIVLADEQMLLPVLSIIPDCKVSNINVTMGYELRYSNISSLAHLMSDIQSPMWQRMRDGVVTYSSRIVLPLLQQADVVACDGLEVTRKLIADMTKSNRSYVTAEEIKEAPLASRMLKAVSPSEIVEYATDVLETVLAHYAQEEKETLNRETTWEALKVARRMGNVIEIIGDDATDSRMLLGIMAGMIDQQKVNFQGMPLGGLQIMGVLETRALDFDHVTILDMTDGNWPRAQASSTLIPMTIRRGFGLPTDDDMTCTYNYYFYRLKHRAKSLTMIRPAKGELGNLDPSRYILQLEMMAKTPIDKQTVLRSISLRDPQRIEIDKSGLGEMLSNAKRISPTALTNYISCGVRFFFDKVVGLHTDDEITEEVDVRQLGNIYHSVMEHLYKADSKTGKLLDDATKRSILKDTDKIDALIIEGFRHELGDKSIHTERDLMGRNIINFGIIRDYVIRTVATETPGTLVTATEQRVHHTMTLRDGQTVELVGTIDRQHTTPDGSYYVADYKTGRVKSRNAKSIEALFDPKLYDSTKAVAQTLVYCYVLRHGEQQMQRPLRPYVIRPQELFAPDFAPESFIATIGEGRGNKSELVYEGATADEFDALLEQTVNDIFDKSKPFTQATETDHCKSCDYRYICKRV